jgi:hypothetical protein
MTCDNILIDLTRCFSTGMGYVALSRTRNLEGIHLINFHIDSIKCSKEAVAEYNRLRLLVNLPPLPECNVKPPIAKLFGKLPKSLKLEKDFEHPNKPKKRGRSKKEIGMNIDDGIAEINSPKKKPKIEKTLKTVNIPAVLDKKESPIPEVISDKIFLTFDNPPGANHCFANAAMQSLFHIPEIRADSLLLAELVTENGTFEHFFSEIGNILSGQSKMRNGTSSVGNLRNHPLFPNHLRIGQQILWNFYNLFCNHQIQKIGKICSSIILFLL